MLTAKEAYKMANENCDGTRLNILNKIDKIIRDAVENQLFFVQYDIENGKEARVAYQVVNTLKTQDITRNIMMTFTDSVLILNGIEGRKNDKRN